MSNLSQESWFSHPPEPGGPLDAAQLRDLKRYATAFDSSPIPIWLNLAGVIVYANPACLRLLGARRATDVKGHSAFRFIHPDDHPKVHRRIAACLSGEPVSALEERIVRLNGTLVDVRAIALALPFGAETVLQISFLDLSEEKSARIILQDSRQLLQDVLDSLFAFVVVLTLDGAVVEANRALLQPAGLSKQEVAGKPLEAAGWWSCTEEARGHIREGIRLAGTGQVSRFDVDARMSGGELKTFDMMLAPLNNPAAGSKFLIASGVDVTARKWQEEALRRNENELQAFANSIYQLAWIANPDGWIYWYNSRWYEYTGATPAQMEGWGWQVVHDPDTLPSVLERWSASIATGEPFEMVFPLKGADGVFRPFLTRGYPAKDDNGNVIRWFGTNTDITAQKQIEEELRRANTDLESFAFAAAHDLQEPLRMVTSYTQLLARKLKPVLDADAQTFMFYVLDGAKRVGTVLEDLLAYTETGREREEPERVNLNEVLSEVLLSCQAGIQESGARVTSDALPEVLGQRTLFFQLFQNLIANAIKYRGAKAPEIHVSAVRDGARWLFRVQDNGVGVPPQYHRTIFGVFKRLHGRDIPGTGIGLAICKRVVERSGGGIWVESEGDNRGSTFCFTLPA